MDRFDNHANSLHEVSSSLMPNKLFLEGAANLSDQLDRMNLNEEYSNQGISSVGRREQLSVWDRPSHNLNDETSTHNLITHLELMEKFRNPSRFSENSSQVLPEMGNLRAQETNQLWDLGERMNYGGNSTGPNFSGGAVSVPAKMALGVNDGNWRSGATVQEQRTYTPLSQFLNSKGLPLRPGEPQCAYYMKSGNCKFGPGCKFNHPEVNSSKAISSGFGPEAGMPWLPVAVPPVPSPIFPERIGQPECAYYLKTGTCKFGPGCRFHHPRVRPSFNSTNNGTSGGYGAPVKLTLAGLPRRDGEVSCAYYMKTGTCKYGASCKFDHPPPGEAAAIATALAEKKKDNDNDNENEVEIKNP